MPSAEPVKCFVVMPYGPRKDADGKDINFDDVYDSFVKPTIEAAGLECNRCDKMDQAGAIYKKMIIALYHSEVALVDITSLNPNVFYELGVRHAVASGVTVLIRRHGTNVPFNISGMQVIDYADDYRNDQVAAKRIAETIRYGLETHYKDSPVFEALGLRSTRGMEEAHHKETFTYPLNNLPGKSIGLILGKLQDVDGIDVWVNSENTDMHMSRPMEQTVSGVIRYLGATKDEAGNIVEDTIVEALNRIGAVKPGRVVPTEPGELKMQGVKKIFHAASVIGQPGTGFRPIPDVGMCVTNALALADAAQHKETSIKSIVFPLMGTGAAGAEPEQAALRLIRAAVEYLKHKTSQVETVHFIVLNKNSLAACQRALAQIPEVATSGLQPAPATSAEPAHAV